VVTLSGPTSVYACHRYNWTVSVQNVTSGTWLDSDGFSKSNGDLFLTDYFNDWHESYPEWIQFTGRGPGGEVVRRINITVLPDPDVPDRVRDVDECRSVANAGPIHN
jgi:hypothetical protein